MENFVDRLYNEMAAYYGISVQELVRRIVSGERIVDQYVRRKR